jgi:hypothetical protein
MTATRIARPAPRPMPVGREHYALKKPADLVTLMTPLVELVLDDERFTKYMTAQYDEHAVTGKVLLDRDRALAIVMAAAPDESLLRQEKESTLIKVVKRAMGKFAVDFGDGTEAEAAE